MRRFLLVSALTGSLALFGGGPIAAPADAVTSVSVSISNDIKVRQDDCGSTTISVTGDWAADRSVSVDITVYDPDGDWAGGDYVQPYSSTASTSVELCGYYDESGTYDVEVEVSGYTNDYRNTSATGYGSFALDVIKPTRAGLGVQTRRINQGPFRWQAVGRLVRDGKPYGSRAVQLQARIEGLWIEVDRSYSRTDGRVGWQFKPNGFRWRLHFDGNKVTRPATSDIFSRGTVRGRSGEATETVDAARAAVRGLGGR